MTTTRKTAWNTYATRGYTYDATNDQASAGGVHHHQVRRTASGHWQTRICQCNGRRKSYGPISPVSDADGEAYYAMAQQR